MLNWRVIISALLAGTLGTLLSLSAWHLYNDHKVFHALLNSIAQNQQRQQSQEPQVPKDETPK